MKNFTKILILSVFTILMIGGFANSAFAVVAPLSVNFSAYPLFNEGNFVPGNEVVRTVEVSNNSGSSQNIIIEATNASDKDGLGEKLNLVIKEGESEIYKKTLGEFLRAGEISLSLLSNSSNITYSLGIMFESDAENNLQNKKLGFDLCVGFQGGETHCGNTVIGGENGGGGGSISGSVKLVISNEQANDISNINESGSTTITWKTNKLATSQVIYGLTSGGPYNLDLDAANFGYPLSNTEDPIKITDHSMLISGLIPGETYSYRVVSRASPATVSFEHKFTIPTPVLASNNQVAINTITNQKQGDVLGDIENNVNGNEEEIPELFSNNLAASAFFSGLGDILSSNYVIAFLILVFIYLMWRLWLRKKYKNLNSPKK